MPNKVKYFYELTVSSSPHVHGPNRTGRLMLDVIRPFCLRWWAAWCILAPGFCWCADCLWPAVCFLNGATGR